MTSRFRLLVAGMIGGLVLLSLFGAIPSKADELYGRIRGVVMDSSHAAMPGVPLRLVNEGTGIAKEMTSESDGSFLFVSLSPGTYTLTATKPGFKTFQARGISVIQSQIYVQNVTMDVGVVSETLEVTANPVQVESTSIQLGATLSGEMVQDLPTLNRNWITLQQTLPGVVAPDTRFGSNYSTNGSQAQQNSFLINGNDANDLPLNSPLVQPNPDAIAEVQMVTNTINPEYGRNSGAIMNATTKSGTNSFHGSVFDFYRDTFLNTKNFFQPKAPIHQNQYGGTVGGPIWRNKLFFFYSLQNTRARTPQNLGNNPVVYTAQQLGGNWTGSTLSSNTVPGQLAGKIVGAGGTGAGGTCTATQTWAQCFPTNQVPTTDYNSVSTALVTSFVPAPNVNGNQFAWSPVTTVATNQHIGRMDLTITQKDSLWFNAIANDSTQANQLPFSGSTLPGFGDGSIPYTKYLTASWIHTFTPSMLNELRAGYSRLNFPTGQPQHVRLPSSVGFSNIFPQFPAEADLPKITVNNYFTIGGTNNGPQPRKDQTYQITDNFSWTAGRHSFKFGYDGRKFQVWNPFANSNEGAFTFSKGGGYSTGDPGLDFLLGVPTSYGQGAGAVIIADAYEHYFYFQDLWHIKSNLTLTLGTGYQIDTPIAEYQNGGLSRACFQPGEQSTVFPTAPVGLTYPGDPGCNKEGGPTTKLNHIGPRVGFAWSPGGGSLDRFTGGNGKTSIRGGFGLYFNRSEEELNLQDLSTPPFGLTSSGAANPSFPNPYADLNSGAVTGNPFPYVAPAKGTSPNFATLYPFGYGFSYSNNPKSLTVPHTMNWNFTIQRELPAQTILSVGYVGAHGSGLITSYTENPATPTGVAACLANTTCNSNGGIEPILFPGNYAYPGNVWDNFGQQTNAGWSNYNALQITVNKHLSHGLEFQSAYTWSHSLDISSSFEDTAFQLAGGISNYGPDRARDYGNSSFDARHRWVIDFVYTAPSFAKNWGPVASRMLDGWVFTGINTFQSGSPITFEDSDLRSLSCTWELSFYGCSDRPDIVSRPTKLDPHTATFGGLPNFWFNPASFTDNALGTEGNTPRGYFNGPGLWNTDFVVRKDFKIMESSSLRTEIDFFNLFNHTNFANPVNDFGAGPLFGQIEAIRSFTNSRLIQLGAKFVF